MKLTEGVLASRRCVKIDYDGINTITIKVMERDINIITRSRMIPVHIRGLFPFDWFERPLVERIRRAVVECDEEIDEEIEASKNPTVSPNNQKLVDVAYAALYHSPGGDYPQGYQPPPPLVGPPDSPPSE